jgi:hypothetical protein
MRMEELDISSMENKTKEDKFAFESNYSDNDNFYNNNYEDLNSSLTGQNYNLNWTLRKCSAKILDRFSNWWPKWTIENTKSFLEIELQNEDWINK